MSPWMALAMSLVLAALLTAYGFRDFLSRQFAGAGKAEPMKGEPQAAQASDAIAKLKAASRDAVEPPLQGPGGAKVAPEIAEMVMFENDQVRGHERTEFKGEPPSKLRVASGGGAPRSMFAPQPLNDLGMDRLDASRYAAKSGVQA